MLNSPALDVCAEHIHKKLHIGIVNYLHREWYENYLSIYQHYNSWHAKCVMLLTVTVQNVGDRWWADLIKIEHSNNQTPLDTTPANTAEISIVPPTPTWERWVLSNQQSKDGVAVLVTVWGYNHPPSCSWLTTHNIHLTQQNRGEKGGVFGQRQAVFYF